MYKISKWFKLTCEDTSLLISEKMDHRLPLRKRWRAGLHLVICAACREYQNQLRTLRSLARCLGNADGPTDPSLKLSPEARERLKQSLK